MCKQAMPIVALLLFAVCQKANSQEVADPGFRQLTPFEIKIHSLCKEVAENGRTTDKLSANDFADLPLGIARQSGGSTYIIAIDSAYSEERGWFFSAYASIKLPGTKQPIAFAAKNIAFNAGGLASSSQIKLLLVSTIKIEINDKISMLLPGDGRNFIEWDCNGFKSINLKGDFIFSDSVVEPDTDLAKGATTVTASFEINTKDLNDILIGVSITPFKIVGVDDLSFEVKNAVADFSDITNPKGFVFPPQYQQTFGADLQLWRGFFIQEADVRLTGFSGNEKKPTIQAKNLLIDDLGFSGTIGAANLLSLSDGSAGGWPLSINEMSVTFLLNRITGGSLAGLLNVPFLGEESVPYAAQMEQVGDDLNYRFSLATTGEKRFTTPFNAKVVIGKGSVISIEKRNGQLIPSTLLNGMMFVEAGALKADDIKFERLGLTTQAPYITSGVFSTASSNEPRAVGFPVRIDSIRLGVFQGQASLAFALALNLMNKDDKGFSASTYVQLLAKMHEIPVATTTDAAPIKRQEWKFEKIKINDILLDCNTTAISIKGRASVFDNDPTYGNGFRGNLTLRIGELLGKGVQVNAYFGSKEVFRYWHFDAYVPVGSIPIVPPIMYINGFMGGASYHMSRKQPFAPDFTKLNVPVANNTPQQVIESSNQFVYLPDEKSGMAFMAGITLIAGSEKAFNADALFEITFSASGGMRYVSFTGSGFFLTAVENRGRGKDAKAPVYASLNMLYDSDNSIFHANLKTYINLLGVIKGVGPNGLVGEAVIHIDPRDWYIYIGRPSQMMGIDLASLAVAQSYFMIGTQIEDMAPPPYEVQEIFGQIQPASMRDGNMMARGRGFAVGARFRVGFDSGSDLFPFYIAVAVGAGADVMIRDYGDATCAGRTDKIGINGWYASGQAYVFLRGKVGVRVAGSDFDIVSLGAAALLEAKLPNPSWMKGQLGGSYKILGGLISGRFNLSLTIGDKCEIVNQGNELGGIKVIESLKPDADGKDVSVFTATQVSFNTNMETEFSMTNVDNQLNSYRVRLQEFSITKNGTAIAATLVWNDNKDVAILRTSEILPPQSDLKAVVKIYWEKKVNAGAWIPLKRNGQIDYETKEASFTTGTAPDFIPEENVSFSHPVKYQYNFLTNESATGYVKLGMGQEYLFKQDNNTAWDFFAKFEGPAGVLQTPLTYNASQAKASFNIPGDLALRTVYKFSFIKKPRSTGGIDQNVQRNQTNVVSGKESEVNVASNSLDGTITQNVEKDIYTSAFRTSQFRTFEEKINSLNGQQDQFDVAKGMVAVIGQRGNMPETFDEYELKGGENELKPMVQVAASQENTWFKDTIAPLLYDSYSSFGNGIDIKWRKPEELGLKPLKGVSLLNDLGNYKLQESNVTSRTAPAKSGSILIGYYLSFYSYWDYDELKSKAARLYLSNISSASSSIKNLIVTNYTDLIPGYYPVEITYLLPGTTQPSYRRTVQIKF